MDIKNKDLIVNILTDSIIFQRAASAIDRLLDSFDFAESGWEASDKYEGYANTFILFGIENNPELKKELGKIFFNCISESKDNAKELALKVFNEFNTYKQIEFTN